MTSVELRRVSAILGGKKILRGELSDDFDLIELGERGITRKALENLAEYLDLSMSEMAGLLPVSERTIQRCGAGKSFNRVISEQILHLAEVAARGAEVFEDREKFLAWLNQPSRALAGEAPLRLLRSRFGAAMVLGELGRMEHGIFA
jgi:putative toxin-antitoxin system antitoxin component (TIGR02293 family)